MFPTIWFFFQTKISNEKVNEYLKNRNRKKTVYLFDKDNFKFWLMKSKLQPDRMGTYTQFKAVEYLETNLEIKIQFNLELIKSIWSIKHKYIFHFPEEEEKKTKILQEPDRPSFNTIMCAKKKKTIALLFIELINKPEIFPILFLTTNKEYK